MKIYQNERYGFAIQIPESWSFHSLGKDGSLIFKCSSDEAFNILISPGMENPDLNFMEDEFARFAHKKGYTHLSMGRITVVGSEHLWIRYYLGGGLWVKKFILVLSGTRYEITATCLEERLLPEVERTWDQMVASFRLLHEMKSTGLENIPTETDTGEVLADHLVGMKTYRNEKHGFEISIPEAWSPPPAIPYAIASMLSGPMPRVLQKDVFQYGCREEAFNVEISPLSPEPALEDTDTEFQLYARDHNYADLVLGRITVAGKEHVCASYFINDNMGSRWNKKYMLVFGGVEYVITATCNDPQFFTAREPTWNTIIQTFRPLKPWEGTPGATASASRELHQRRDITEKRLLMREIAGDLYAQGYEAVSIGDYKRARVLLEQCIRENPQHTLAYKELAVVLEKMGNIPRAIQHRMEVKRLAPDDIVNNAKLNDLLARSGKKTEARHHVQEALKITPGNPMLQKVQEDIQRSRLPNYRVMFFSGLICLLLTDLGFFFPEYVAIRNVGCMTLMMLLPTWCVWVSGPWVGIPKAWSALLAGGLYLFFLVHAW